CYLNSVVTVLLQKISTGQKVLAENNLVTFPKKNIGALLDATIGAARFAEISQTSGLKPEAFFPEDAAKGIESVAKGEVPALPDAIKRDGFSWYYQWLAEKPIRLGVKIKAGDKDVISPSEIDI